MNREPQSFFKSREFRAIAAISLVSLFVVVILPVYLVALLTQVFHDTGFGYWHGLILSLGICFSLGVLYLLGEDRRSK